MLRKRYLLATVSMLAVVGATALPALAADLPSRAPVMKAPVREAPFSWAGFYVGVHGGYGWLDYKQTTVSSNGVPLNICSTSGATDTCSSDASGGVFGGFAGYNWQSGNIVFGVEADGSWAAIKQTQSDPANNLSSPITLRGEVEWLATIRGRLGLAFGQTLIYGTGGVAFGGVNSGWTTASVPAIASFANDTKTGWVAGGGIEHAFARGWSIRAEVLYHDLGKDTASVTAIGSTYSTTFRHTVTTARAGLALRW